METVRLRIEPLSTRHAADLFEALQASGLYTFIPDEPPASTDALRLRFERLIRGSEGEETWRNWVLFLRGGRRPVGTLQATIFPDARALIAYSVLPAFWRQGFGTEAVGWMLGELHETEGVPIAEAVIDTENRASIALVVRLGFRLVATARNAAVLKGRRSDEYRFERRLGPEQGGESRQPPLPRRVIE
jgi:RimJ/RimL family protein N-acetyltransferase